MPEAIEKTIKHADTPIDIAAIYQNDLFNTYQQPIPKVDTPSPIALPPPPIPSPIPIPKKPKPQFKDPMDIALKGTIVFSDNSNNIAIISDNKTKKEKNYKEGHSIEDAQLIRIFHNKIILLRSNAQQEIVYIDEEEAKREEEFTQKIWSAVVKNIDKDEYIIDPYRFVEYVPSLGSLINILNIATVYKDGISIGCRIGKYPEDSIAPHMGLVSGDIITHINDIKTTTNENRMNIYNIITELKLGDKINLKIQRKKQPIELIFTMQVIKQKKEKDIQKEIEKEGPIVLGQLSEEQLKAEKVKLLENRYKFAPTAEKIKESEKEKMIRYGNKDLKKRLGITK